MERAGIDISLSLSILRDYNAGIIGQTPPVIPKGIPEPDGERILDLRNPESVYFTGEQINRFLKQFPEFNDLSELTEQKGGRNLSVSLLEKIGTRLFSRLSYGFLNGGSATSYGDIKKNRAFNPELFDLYEKTFLGLSQRANGRPKGVTPAFIQPDGTEGPSYMEMKLRSLLICSRRGNCRIPFFQMTSVANNGEVTEALKAFGESPWLKDLASERDFRVWEGLTGVQPMITAYTHSSIGREKGIFRTPDQENGRILPLPGGHGQCFRVLKDTFKTLHDRGIRFVSLGNIDNLGYTPDALSLAVLAIKGNPAGFDFSFRTAVDVKGGVLVIDQDDRLNCVDLGVGIPSQEIEEREKKGAKILFNCATGLFDLTWLLENIDRIMAELPTRFSDQSKDAGNYSQAEQVTWEVIGMIENPLIFGIDKFKRFLAAKMLVENMLTSGIGLDSPDFPGGKESDLAVTAARLHKGLENLLTTRYDLVLENNTWQPREASGKKE